MIPKSMSFINYKETKAKRLTFSKLKINVTKRSQLNFTFPSILMYLYAQVFMAKRIVLKLGRSFAKGLCL